MNVSPNLVKIRYLLLWTFSLFLGVSSIRSQSLHPLTTASGLVVRDTIKGNNIIVYKSAPHAKHGTVTQTTLPTGQSNPTWVQVNYQPDPGFVGVDTFAIGISYNGAYPFLAFKVYEVKVYPTIIKTVQDYVQTTVGTPVLIDVLSNDIASHGPLTLTEIPLVTRGSALLVGNEILYTPAAGFVGVAHINYQTCDATFACKSGSVAVNVVDNSSPISSSTIQLNTAKNTSVSRVLPDTGFVVQTNPGNGVVTMDPDYRYVYNPNSAFVGTDTFVLVNNNFTPSVTQTVIVDVFNTPSPNTMAMDDYYFTRIGQPISFNVRTNDFGTNSYTVQGFTPPPPSKGTLSNIHSGGNGNVTFTPASGFTGVAKFKYTIYNSMYPNTSYTETAEVNVVVGDMDPAQATFDLTTPTETPLVINYQIPFIGFDFYITDAPDNGSMALYPGYSTQIINGQTVTGYSLLVYAPNSGYVGSDEITLNYCVNGGGTCYSVKLNINVIETVYGTAPYCLDDCVWTGDVNNDGVVNNKDILPLGYFMGEDGFTRPNAAMEWFGQYGDNWSNPFYSLPFDMKHADTDGNGLISCSDTVAVSQFYGQVHTLFPTIPPTGKGLPFFLDLPTTPVSVGDHVVVPVSLGNANYPVSNLYGFTFDISLSPLIVESGLKMEFSDYSYLNADAPSLQFSKNPKVNRLESAFTRTNGMSTSGYGQIGYFDFIIEEVIDDIKSGGNASISVRLDQPTMMMADGSTVSFESQTFEIPLRFGASDPTVSALDFQVFPNPTTEFVQVFLNGTHEIEELSILDVMGRRVYNSGSVRWERSELSVAHLPAGTYFIHALTTGGVVVKKLQVVKKD